GFRIKSFVEKPPLEKAPSRLANAGFYVLDRRIFQNKEWLEKFFPLEVTKTEYTAFPLLSQEKKLAGFSRSVSYWYDMGTLESYKLVNQLATEGKIKTPLSFSQAE
ncbi:MAG: NDP-sugar synthase, partial [Candidatus Hodarchaeota archaeon]